MLLPWVTLALVLAATYTRLTRSSMLDVLAEDYIRTARSKGLSVRRVVLRHGLRSALTPVVTQFGIDLGQLVGGVVVTETARGVGGSRRGQHPGRRLLRRPRSTGSVALNLAEAPDTLRHPAGF
jgi:ABC-type antimicrobial peptide transport system permease subunit